MEERVDETRPVTTAGMFTCGVGKLGKYFSVVGERVPSLLLQSLAITLYN